MYRAHATSGLGPNIPALLQSSRIWSPSHGRLILPVEHSRVLNSPTGAVKDQTNRQGWNLVGSAMHIAALSAVSVYVFAFAERDHSRGPELATGMLCST